MPFPGLALKGWLCLSVGSRTRLRLMRLLRGLVSLVDVLEAQETMALALRLL